VRSDPPTLWTAATPVPGGPFWNLPTQPTTFVGRQLEIARLLTLVPEVPLMTLSGAGGCGKTRLALEVVARAAPGFSQGAWFVELAALTEPTLVVHAVASVLGVGEQSGRQLLDVLVDALAAHELLLVLDNCEHLLPACAELVTRLLGECPRVHVVATSRERLNVAGETVWRVPSLSLPVSIKTQDAPRTEFAAYLMNSEAVQLYVQRAASVQPDFRLTDENAEAVAIICQRLDGMPLALELAAARAPVLSPEQIATRLDDCFRVLSHGTHGAPHRQQTLQAALDWSYHLLTLKEQRVFRSLSVFGGTLSLEAAEAVCADDDIQPQFVLDLLAQLVDKSLVQAEAHTGETRYRLLETIRQYGRERLEESGDVERARGRHRDWYLELAERAEPQLWSTAVRAWLDRLELEHDNLRSAFAWCVATDVERGQRLAASLYVFWERRGYLAEGRSCLESVLTVSGVTGDPPTRTRARALLGAGYIARDQGDIEAAKCWVEESLSLFRGLGDKWGIGSSLRALGLLAQSESNRDQARALLEEAVALFREVGRPDDVGWTLRNLGILAQIEGDHPRAYALFEESLPILRQLGDRTGTARVLGSLGILGRIRGDYERARALLEESCNLLLAVEDKRGVGMSLGALGSLARIQGDSTAAFGFFERSLTLGHEMGDLSCIAHSLGMRGVMAIEQGEHARGVRFIAAATATQPLLGSSIEIDERAALESTLAEAQATLGEQAFAAVWTEGHRMTVDEAVESALVPRREHPPVKLGEAQPKRRPGGLTRREAEVLRLVSLGKTNREIAGDLVLSEYTVMRHVSNIFRKIGASSRAAAASFAVREGIS